MRRSSTGGTPGGEWTPQFMPTLCPDCGWDLFAERDSCILLCTGCNTAWQASGDGLQPTPYGAAPADHSGKKTLHLPFWRIKVSFEGLQLESYGDLVRLANLPKAPRTEWEKPGLSFWVPAFKVPGPLSQARTATHPFQSRKRAS